MIAIKRFIKGFIFRAVSFMMWLTITVLCAVMEIKSNIATKQTILSIFPATHWLLLYFFFLFVQSRKFKVSLSSFVGCCYPAWIKLYWSCQWSKNDPGFCVYVVSIEVVLAVQGVIKRCSVHEKIGTVSLSFMHKCSDAFVSFSVIRMPLIHVYLHQEDMQILRQSK